MHESRSRVVSIPQMIGRTACSSSDHHGWALINAILAVCHLLTKLFLCVSAVSSWSWTTIVKAFPPADSCSTAPAQLLAKPPILEMRWVYLRSAMTSLKWNSTLMTVQVLHAYLLSCWFWTGQSKPVCTIKSFQSCELQSIFLCRLFGFLRSTFSCQIPKLHM